jgi:hypothetical protein
MEMALMPHEAASRLRDLLRRADMSLARPARKPRGGNSGRHSVGAGVRQGFRVVGRVIGATKAVVVKAAAGEMFAVDAVHVTDPGAADMTSADTADVRAVEATDVSAADATDVSATEATDVNSAEAADVSAADATDVSATEATDVNSAEATHVSATEAAHVASTEATYVASAATMATATAAACLRARGQKAAGKHCTCQNHHHP